jgi:hypothetical protein
MAAFTELIVILYELKAVILFPDLILGRIHMSGTWIHRPPNGG